MSEIIMMGSNDLLTALGNGFDIRTWPTTGTTDHTRAELDKMKSTPGRPVFALVQVVVTLVEVERRERTGREWV